MQLKKELVYREFVQRENNLLRAPYNPEVSFYAAIKEGDVAKVKQLCQESLLDKEGLGTLSDHYLQNIKYHYVITTAIIARYCIEGGMELSNAYSLSDFYIQKRTVAKRQRKLQHFILPCVWIMRNECETFENPKYHHSILLSVWIISMIIFILISQQNSLLS